MRTKQEMDWVKLWEVPLPSARKMLAEEVSRKRVKCRFERTTKEQQAALLELYEWREEVWARVRRNLGLPPKLWEDDSPNAAMQKLFQDWEE